MSAQEVFENKPALLKTTTLTGSKYLTVRVEGNNLTKLMPYMSFKLSSSVDCSISKTFAGNFAVTVFQDMPVTLSVSGIIATQGALFKDSGLCQAKQLIKLYEDYKLSKKQDVVTVTIDSKQFVGYIIGLQMSNSTTVPGLINYTMVFTVTPK